MFDNIGGKIKGLATVLCWVGIIVSCIVGFIFIVMGISASGSRYTGDMAPMYYIVGIAVGVIGSLLSWIGSFFMYGFGELIERAAAIDRKLPDNQAHPTAYVPAPSTTLSHIEPLSSPRKPVSSATNGEWACSSCGRINKNYVTTCVCGQPKNKR